MYIMNKLFKLSICAAVALMAFGCTKDLGNDEFVPRQTIHRSFTLSFDDVSTRTSIESDGSVAWSANDTIRYFSSYSGTVGKHVVSASGPYTTIEADIPAGDKFFTAVYGGTGVTPNPDDGSFDIEGVVLPVQNGTFPESHVSVAYTSKLDTNKISFKNVTSLIKFTITSPEVSSVEFTSNNGEALTGGGSINVYTAANGKHSVKLGKTRNTSIRVNVNGAGTYYMSVLPGTLEGGFTLKCFKQDGSRAGVAEVTKSVEIAQNTILNLGTVETRLTEPEDICMLNGSFETANCYIVPVLKEYKFKATVKGNNTNVSLGGTPVSAQVLWESTNNGAACNIGTVVSGVSYDAGYVYFKANRAGSAIVAVYDKALDDPAKKILWSWHLWVWPGYDIESAMVQYYNNAGALMDRNLGAVNATPGDYGALGLMYQWGRKDPFVGSYTTPVGTLYETIVTVSEETGTIAYSIEHPTTFIAYASTNPGDWLYTRDDTLWQGDFKTIYDPCPPGWRMPPANFWATAKGSSSNFYYDLDWNLGGMNFGGVLGASPTIWYPAGGYRPGNSQYGLYPTETGAYGMWWAAGTYNYCANNFAILKTNRVTVQGTTAVRANGYSVRCITDYVRPTIHVKSISVNPDHAEIERFSSIQLSATISPYNADNLGMTWSSSDNSIASVDQNGLVTANGIGVATIKVVADEYPETVFATCTITVKENQEENLSAKGTANCYIVNHPGSYRFIATVKGNSSQSVGTPASAELLWESYGTSVWYTRHSIIDYDSVTYSNGYVTFNVNSPLRNGNAVIAVRDSNRQVLWSWHIWVCDGFNPDATAQTYYSHDAQGELIENGPVVMDRNLGATSIVKGEVQNLGLYYQWGRKDPFPGPEDVYTNVQAAVSDPLEEAISSSQTVGTVEYATAHPTQFIKNETSSQDWMWVKNDGLWASTKTIYDPCPNGWRVSDGGPNGLWCKATGTDGQSVFDGPQFDTTHYGTDFGGVFGKASTIWYPATAYILASDGKIWGQGQYGPYWSCTPYYNRSYGLYVYMGGIQLASNFSRASGYAVRCVKE